ncbi:putative bifunctional diguanylate cyclase/phosphodiesterase [Pseudobacteroides cellulosolvens]|uniref:Diguanylate cyclase/phosphodiesterase n=1 Tax=Pseudobacteroides cellulosolvens ATCC 35603 = DSM 2933 TaxID=398512 RepID=A0A0L6JIX8_9FIRM|nr:bifunctional diguanylate cyclase/phosphodiesterase [Pseudobacteroides cellulosolvens]KNY25806.1 diguanylate cyclase/phosphodiesterase [Pseudobacteroides cellulosolvens ATCC 35603 = DSM 2933]
MKKQTYISIQIVLGIYFIIYFISAVFQSDFWGNILSPIGTFAASIILFTVYLRPRKIRFHWLCASLACFFWFLADILWAVYDLVLGLDPDEIDLITYIYMLPNIFLAIASGIFFISQWHKWNKVQLILDVLAITSSGITLVWILLFHKQSEMILSISADSFTTFISIICDFFAGCCIVIWFNSNRNGKIANSIHLVVIGVFLYICSDLYYSHQLFRDEYIPNSLIDSAYMASFLLIAWGGLIDIFYMEKTNITTDNIMHQNTGASRKALIILSVPILLILVNNYEFKEVLIFGCIIAVYQILSSYVQYTIRNEQLLQREKELNSLLEEKIAEHTKDLLDANNNLKILSQRDQITGLFNRRYFLDSLDQMLNDTMSGESVYIIFMDMDRFKSINDSYGHDIGDKVLMEIGDRLESWNTYNALLARLGGDEFVIAVRGRFQHSEIKKMVSELIKCCNKPININNYEFNITLSAGITQYPNDANERSSLMKNADIAMYNSKSQGYNQYSFFNSELNSKILRKNEIELLLKNANFDKEFELYYQPQIKIPENNLIGVEALLRWKALESGHISPAEFIPIAEEIGIIVPLGEWIIKQAVMQISKWNNLYDSDLKVGINISPKQLDTPNFIDYVLSIIKTYSIKPSWLDMEITESIAMKGESTVQSIFATIANLGISISIDDFGTGYSSLSYIKKFSFNKLKIAKPLVDNISTDSSEAQIIKAIVMMAKTLGIKAIAEGVESEEQLKLLISLQCDEVQGYIFGHPLPASEFERMHIKQFANK